MKKINVLAITEAGIMVALASVLSVIKLLQLPYGGSVTVASMLPIIIYAYRHGFKRGVGAALSASVIQLLLGLRNFSYFTTWQSLVALGLFDYVLAFTVFGIAPLFKKIMPYRSALVSAALTSSALRYICHTITGATVWAGLSVPTSAALIYSLSYNATYMIPEAIILTATTLYMSSAVDFSRKVPRRTATDTADSVGYLYRALAGLSVLVAVFVDTRIVFRELQGVTGEFAITALSGVNWLAVAIVSAVCTAIAALLLVLAKRAEQKGQ